MSVDWVRKAFIIRDGTLRDVVFVKTVGFMLIACESFKVTPRWFVAWPFRGEGGDSKQRPMAVTTNKNHFLTAANLPGGSIPHIS